MSNFLSLLPLALDAGSPHEQDDVVARRPRVEPEPLPAAWLVPQPEKKRTRAVTVLRALALALWLGLAS
jgi:hypothetical protein